MLLELALGAWAAKNLKDLGAGKVIKGVVAGAKEGIADVKAEQKAKKDKELAEQEERIASTVVKSLLANAKNDADRQAIIRTLNGAADSEQRQKTAA